ncbi:hypothetical protein E6C60_0850 [Paenibacillus algicola]|uniref:Uncharacterized protein n=1 Tax=Paenibacillus algicola TaxID=2565926 RepID=A0A4P8XJM5_9BACL|nr:EH signature domain-containing protein [Paenibacillus algicola]QCT01571.1 hypothetical protein E6C60_0850 [Paenibacillus algicola]
MEINKYFYMFSFEPQLLTEERHRVERKFENKAADIIKRRGKMLLPNLLELIRSTPMDQIEGLAKKLKKMEVLLLIYEDYPFPDENPETVFKINQILTARYSNEVGKTAWNMYQHLISDNMLQDLLRRIFQVDQFGFLLLEVRLQRNLEQAIFHIDGMVQGMTSMLLSLDMGIKDVFEKLKVEENSKLEMSLMKRVLEQGLSTDFIINRDGTEFIARLLDTYPMDEYKQLIKIYFEARSYDHFHAVLTQQAIDRLRDPRERLTDWHFLNDQAVGEVKRWLIQRKLQIIFKDDQDNKRLNYWKRFIDHMRDVELIQDPMIAFIYFDQFVVVEYGNIGAAYFYHREGFDNIIQPISTSHTFRNSRSRTKKEYMLKVPEPIKKGHPLFINKLGHHGRYWTDKFDEHMRYYLDGVF